MALYYVGRYVSSLINMEPYHTRVCTVYINANFQMLMLIKFWIVWVPSFQSSSFFSGKLTSKNEIWVLFASRMSNSFVYNLKSSLEISWDFGFDDDWKMFWRQNVNWTMRILRLSDQIDFICNRVSQCDIFVTCFECEILIE